MRAGAISTRVRLMTKTGKNQTHRTATQAAANEMADDGDDRYWAAVQSRDRQLRRDILLFRRNNWRVLPSIVRSQACQSRQRRLPLNV